MELFRKFREKAFLELAFEEKDVAVDAIKKILKINHIHNFCELTTASSECGVLLLSHQVIVLHKIFDGNKLFGVYVLV